MESNIVFLDTSVIVRKIYLLSNALTKLTKYSKHGYIEIVICDIVYNEIIDNMRKDINEASIEMQKNISLISSKCRVYKNFSKYQPIFELREPGQDKDEDFIDLKQRFDEFIKDSNIKIIPVTNEGAQNIFNAYFKTQLPFKEGQKKNEFPDAFILATYEKYCSDNNIKGYLISNDSDMIAYNSESLIILDSLEKINDLLNTKYDISQFEIMEQKNWQELSDELWNKAWNTVNMRQNLIQKDLENELIKLIVSDLYSRKTLVTYEVFKINDINIEIKLPFGAEADFLDSVSGVIVLDSKATVTIDVEIVDRSRGYYDDETDKWIGEQIISKRTAKTISFEVEVKVIHTPLNLNEKPSYQGFENLEYEVDEENFGLW